MELVEDDTGTGIPDGDTGDNLAREDLLAAMAEGALLSNHCPTPYKSEQKIQALKTIRLQTDATMARTPIHEAQARSQSAIVPHFGRD